jgi:hypothetical protein
MIFFSFMHFFFKQKNYPSSKAKLFSPKATRAHKLLRFMTVILAMSENNSKKLATSP